MKQPIQGLSRGAQGGGVPHSSVSPGRCAASSFTCAMGHPTTLLRRGRQTGAGRGAWGGAAPPAKEGAAKRSGDTEWAPPPVSCAPEHSARQPLFHGLRVVYSAMEN